MKVEKNKVASLSYQLEVEGKIADQAGSDSPLQYIHGTGMLLPEFEKAVEGKQKGETFDFVLSPENGYGTYDPKYKVDIPKDSFMVDGVLREDLLVIGNVIPMFNSDGQVIQGTVAGIAENTVSMDFNHPMAGKTLHFTGKVEDVRDATMKELSEGLHGEYLPKEDCGHCHGHKDGEGCCHGKKDGCHEEEGGCNCHGNCRN